MKKSILILILLLFVTNLPVHAQDEKKETFEDLFNKTYADILYSEILKKVDFGLESYFNGELMKKEITCFNKWVPLETISGERYAFFIPLSEDDIILGYAVIGAVDGNYRMLELTLDAQKLTEKILEASDSYSIAYKFPSGFIVNKEANYYLIDYNLNEVDITPTKLKYGTELINQLKEESKEIQIEKSSSITESFSTIDSAYLSNYSNFVPVGGVYYGGNQWWLDDNPPGYMSEFWAARSCGPTAVANAAYHMSKNKPGMNNLYSMSGISQNEFRTFMNTVYGYVTPGIFGITTISSIADKFEAYASSRNVTLSRVISSTSWNISNISYYIKQGLSINSPVLMITWNTPNSEIDFHWVTITGYYYNTLSNDRTVTVANNGVKQIHDLQAWYDDGSFYQGLIYFN
ncbi:hypothetical protein [Fusibacter bizertensis]